MNVPSQIHLTDCVAAAPAAYPTHTRASCITATRAAAATAAAAAARRASAHV